MKTVARSEILDYVTYGERRDAERARVLAIKRPRRIHLGEHLTFLFENTDTLRYQIQEMVRVERIVKEADIQHELDTYNAMIPAAGELSCTLLIEIPDEAERKVKLAEWVGLPETIYARLGDGRRVPATCEESQNRADKLSSVQYLRFAVAGEAPVAFGVALEALASEVELSPEQQAAMREDLS